MSQLQKKQNKIVVNHWGQTLNLAKNWALFFKDEQTDKWVLHKCYKHERAALDAYMTSYLYFYKRSLDGIKIERCRFQHILEKNNKLKPGWEWVADPQKPYANIPIDPALNKAKEVYYYSILSKKFLTQTEYRTLRWWKRWHYGKFYKTTGTPYHKTMLTDNALYQA